MLTHFDVSTVQQSERFAYWHEEVCRAFYCSDTRPLEADRFVAKLTRTDLGVTQISDIKCEALHAERRLANVRNSPSDEFYLSVLLEGEGRLEQHGRVSRQRQGDLVMYDSAHAFSYTFPRRYNLMLVKIPRRSMLARVPTADRLTSLIIGGHTPLGNLVTDMLRHASALDISDGPTASRVGTSIVDMVASAIDVELIGETPTGRQRTPLLIHAQEHIRSRLDDPDLTVDSIAAALHMSASTLARLFASNGSTVMRWIWEERLAAAHRALVEGRARRVTEVALACGFNSFSHFSRRFKAQFGQSPNTLVRGSKLSH